MSLIWRHFRRVLMWRLIKVKLSNYETSVMDKDENPSRQKLYQAWRRSLLMIALPSVMFSTVFKLLEILNEDKDHLQNYNPLGRFMYATAAFANFLFCLCTFAAWFNWNRYEKSAYFLALGWLGSLVLSTWFLIFPLDFFYRKEFLDKISNEVEDGEELIRIQRFKLGIMYSLRILPLLLTTPMGMIKGALRITGLLPEINLAGWFIVCLSPFFSLVVVTSTIMIAQLGGDTLFLIAIGFIALAPINCVFERKLYTSPLKTKKQYHNLENTQFSIEAMTNVGFVLLIIWGHRKGMLPSLTSVSEFIFELIGRSLTTIVFFSDIFFQVSICHLLCIRKIKAELDWSDLEELTAHFIPQYSEYHIKDQDSLVDASMLQIDDESNNHTTSLPPDQERPTYKIYN